MSFWQILFTAWREAFGAIQRNPIIFGAVFIVLFFVQVSYDYFVPVMNHAQALNSHLPRGPRSTLAHAAIDLVNDVITSIVAAPLMLTVHRFVLLGESSGPLSNGRRLVIFAGYLIAVRLLADVPTDIEGVVNPDTASQVVLLILTSAAWIITIRLLLTYPAAALERPRPLFDSWGLTRGHWWYVTCIMICGWLPLMVLDAAILYGYYRLQPQPVFGVKEVVGVFLSAATEPLYIASGAALVSKLYLKLSASVEIRRTPSIRTSRSSGRNVNVVIILGVFALIQIFHIIFPKSSTDHVRDVIAIICLVPILLMLLFVFYLNAKKRRR